MTKDRALECWPSWDGFCEVCGGFIFPWEDIVRDGDYRLVHRECAVDAQD